MEKFVFADIAPIRKLFMTALEERTILSPKCSTILSNKAYEVISQKNTIAYKAGVTIVNISTNISHTFSMYLIKICFLIKITSKYALLRLSDPDDPFVNFDEIAVCVPVGQAIKLCNFINNGINLENITHNKIVKKTIKSESNDIYTQIIGAYTKNKIVNEYNAKGEDSFEEYCKYLLKIDINSLCDEVDMEDIMFGKISTLRLIKNIVKTPKTLCKIINTTLVAKLIGYFYSSNVDEEEDEELGFFFDEPKSIEDCLELEPQENWKNGKCNAILNIIKKPLSKELQTHVNEKYSLVLMPSNFESWKISLPTFIAEYVPWYALRNIKTFVWNCTRIDDILQGIKFICENLQDYKYKKKERKYRQGLTHKPCVYWGGSYDYCWYYTAHGYCIAGNKRINKHKKIKERKRFTQNSIETGLAEYNFNETMTKAHRQKIDM